MYKGHLFTKDHNSILLPHLSGCSGSFPLQITLNLTLKLSSIGKVIHDFTKRKKQ